MDIAFKTKLWDALNKMPETYVGHVGRRSELLAEVTDKVFAILKQVGAKEPDKVPVEVSFDPVDDNLIVRVGGINAKWN